MKKPRKLSKFISLLICFCFIFEQTGFAQVAGELDLSAHFLKLSGSLTQDKFRPLHLRYLSYDAVANNFKLLLDKGDLKNPQKEDLKSKTKQLLNYFFIGISLPNDTFWVNLRPDSPNDIIDPLLEDTDIGKIFLEADLQLKKDTAQFTSPQTPEGKEYWDKLYKKAEELYGSENITIPTLTRPWIVPDEIIIRETPDNAYIYKATLKVMLEQDYLKDSTTYSFKDERSKALNEYSSQLIREQIIPKLTKEVNADKRYAPLRQVYYSLILAQWFKQKFYGKSGLYSYLIDKKNLNGLTSKDSWSKTTYFNQYKQSFQGGEYNIKEPVYTPTGQVIRSYFSGGTGLQQIIQSATLVSGDAQKDAISVFGLKLIKNNISARIKGSLSLSDPATTTIEIEIPEETPAASPMANKKIEPPREASVNTSQTITDETSRKDSLLNSRDTTLNSEEESAAAPVRALSSLKQKKPSLKAFLIGFWPGVRRFSAAVRESRHEELKKEISSYYTPIERLDELRRTIKDENLLLLLYNHIKEIARKPMPKEGEWRYKEESDRIQKARDMLREDHSKIAMLKDKASPEHVLLHQGRRDTEETVRERIWDLLAHAALLDQHKAIHEITTEQIKEKATGLKKDIGLVRCVDKMTIKEMAALDNTVDYLKNHRAGVINENTYTDTPEFYSEMHSIFNKVAKASGIEPSLLQLVLLDNTGLNAGVHVDISDRVFFEASFLKKELEGGRLTEDGIAAIFAHELSHILSKLKKIVETKELPAVSRRRGEDTSHAEEDYADLFAIKIVDRAGYNVNALARYFKNLSSESRSYISEALGMSTHPPSRVRFREQSRYILNAPYNKDAPGKDVSPEFMESISNFEGTMARYYELETGIRSVQGLGKELLEEVDKQSSAKTYDEGLLYEHMKKSKELLLIFLKWLDQDLNYKEWSEACMARQKNAYSNGRNAMETLVGILHLLNQNRPISAKNGILSLLEENFALLRQAEKKMEEKAVRFNVSEEWTVNFYKYIVVRYYASHYAPLSKEYKRWTSAYKARLKDEMADSKKLIQKCLDTKSNRVVKALLAEMLIEEKDNLVKNLSLGSYLDMFFAAVYRSKLGYETAVKIVSGLLEIAGKDSSEAVWAKIFKVISAIEKDDTNSIISPYQQKNISYDKDSVFAELLSGALAVPAARKLFLDWMLNAEIRQDNFIMDSLAAFTPEEQKEFILKAITLSGQPYTRTLGKNISHLKLQTDKKFMTQLFGKIASVNAHSTTKMFLFEQVFDFLRELHPELSVAGFIRDFYEKGGYVKSEFLEKLIMKIPVLREADDLRFYFEDNKERITSGWAKADGFGYRKDYYDGTYYKETDFDKRHKEYWQGYIKAFGFRQMELAAGVKIERDSLVMRILDGRENFFLQEGFGGYVSLGMVLRQKIDESRYYDYQDQVNQVIPFIFGPGSYEEAVARIVRYLPGSSYRNYALLAALAFKKLGLKPGEEFDGALIKDALDRLNLQERLDAVKTVTRYMVLDENMKSQNHATANKYLAQQKSALVMRQQELKEYEDDKTGFLDAEYYYDVGDRPETQIDLSLLFLLKDAGMDEYLKGVFNDGKTSLQDKIAAVTDLFARPSSMRDMYLALLADHILAENKPVGEKIAGLKSVIAHFSGEQAKTKYTLKALDYETELLGSGQGAREEKAAAIMGSIVKDYFPEPSPVRDDILDSFIDNYAEIPEEYRAALPFYSTVYTSEGRSLETGRDKGDITKNKNLALFLLEKIPSREQRMQFMLWLLGFVEKPAILKKVELQYKVNLDCLKENASPADLKHYSGIGKSLQKELIQSLLWDEQKGIFADIDKPGWQPTAEWANLLGALFDGIFGDEYKDTIYEDIWNIFFTVTPKISWLLTEKVMVNLLIALSRLEKTGEGKIDKNKILVQLLASVGVVGMKLGQSLHSFGYLDDDFSKELEQLKYNSPTPFLKKDLFRILAYRGIENIRVLRKLGEASIKPVYEVEYEGKDEAMKGKKPSAGYEVTVGGEVLRQSFQLLKERLAKRGRALEMPLPGDWFVDFILQSTAEELEFNREVENAGKLKSGLAKGLSWIDNLKLLWVLYRYEGSWRGLKKILSESRPSGVYKVDVPAAYIKPGIPDIIFEEMVDGKMYGTVQDTDGDSEIAFSFISQLIRGFFHGDLHEGNIMRQNGFLRKIWFLDSGSAGNISFKGLLNMVQLLRSLESGNAAQVRKKLRYIYSSIDEDTVAGAIESALKERNTLSKLLYILRELEGNPDPGFLQAIKAFTAAAFILRHLKIVNDVPETIQGSGETEEAPKENNGQQKNTGSLNVKEAATAVLIDDMKSSGKNEIDRIMAAQELSDRFRDFEFSSDWMERTKEAEQLRGLRAKDLTDIILTDGYGNELKGKAFSLLRLFVEKGIWDSYERSPRKVEAIVNIAGDLQQKIILGNWLDIKADDRERMDYFEGLLWMVREFGDLADSREDIFDKNNIEKLRGIIINPDFSRNARMLVADILSQRAARTYQDVKAGDVIGSVLSSFLGSHDSLELEERIIGNINKTNNSARSNLFHSEEFLEYYKERLNQVFAEEISSADFRAELFDFSRAVTGGHFWFDEKSGIPSIKSFFENVLFGGRGQVSHRFEKLFRFINEQLGLFSAATAERGYKAETYDAELRKLAIIIEFSGQFIQHMYSSENSRDDQFYSKIEAQQLKEILITMERDKVFSFLSSVAAGLLSKEKIRIEHKEERFFESLWRIYENLWNLASIKNDTELLTSARADFEKFMASIIDADKFVFGDRDGYPVCLTLFKKIDNSFRIDIGYETKRPFTLTPLLYIQENRRLLVRSYTMFIHKLLGDVEGKKEGIKADNYLSSETINLIKKYLYLCLYEYSHDFDSMPASPDKLPKAEMEQVFKKWFSVILNQGLPFQVREGLLDALLDLEETDWFVADNHFRKMQGFADHDFFSKDKKYLYRIVQETALSAGVIPQVVKLSDKDMTGFYCRMFRYIFDRDDSLITGDREFIRGLRDLLARMREEHQGSNELAELINGFLKTAGSPEAGASSSMQESESSVSSPATYNENETGRVSSSVENKSASSALDKDLGGIDMRSLPQYTKIEKAQGVGSLSVSPVRNSLVVQSLNQDKEWFEIERMASSGIEPSPERIREYLLSLGDPNSQMDKVLACFANILRIEEDRVTRTASELKEILVLVESGKPSKEMRLALSQIAIEPKEPQLVTP